MDLRLWFREEEEEAEEEEGFVMAAVRVEAGDCRSVAAPAEGRSSDGECPLLLLGGEGDTSGGDKFPKEVSLP